MKFLVSAFFAIISFVVAWIVPVFSELQLPVLVAIITFWGFTLYQKLDAIHDLLAKGAASTSEGKGTVAVDPMQ